VTSRFAASVSGRCESPVRAPGVRPRTRPPHERYYAERSSWASSSSTQPTPTAPASQRSSSPKLSLYDGLLIATKGGYERTGPSGRSARGELIGWTPNGRPDHLRSACEASLRRLELDRIDLYQLHTPDPAVPYLESIGALKDLKSEGKIRHIGVSNVTLEQLAGARFVTDISTVQSRLDLTNNRWRDMLTECESHEIGFIPYRPLRAWDNARYQELLTPAASRHSANTNQIALAWMLAVSPVTLPIPGTATRTHLEDNLAAAALRLDQDELQAITAAVGQP
jgi:aryl-alcohol dehydrogenase-like predicted oxidoreductase